MRETHGQQVLERSWWPRLPHMHSGSVGRHGGVGHFHRSDAPSGWLRLSPSGPSFLPHAPAITGAGGRAEGRRLCGGGILDGRGGALRRPSAHRWLWAGERGTGRARPSGSWGGQKRRRLRPQRRLSAQQGLRLLGLREGPTLHRPQPLGPPLLSTSHLSVSCPRLASPHFSLTPPQLTSLHPTHCTSLFAPYHLSLHFTAPHHSVLCHCASPTTQHHSIPSPLPPHVPPATPSRATPPLCLLPFAPGVYRPTHPPF